MNAKSRSSVSLDSGTVISGNDSTGNINSVVVRPGANIFGDIIVIDQNEAAKNIILSSGILDSASGGNNAPSGSGGGGSAPGSGGGNTGINPGDINPNF